MALNKIDLVEPAVVERALAAFRDRGIEVFPIAAALGEGLDPLLDRLAELVAEARAKPSTEGFELFRTPADRLTIEREGSAWRVHGRAVERWVSMTDLANAEAVVHLQARMERAGVDRALVKAGIHGGDEVRIGKATFEWWPSAEGPAEP